MLQKAPPRSKEGYAARQKGLVHRKIHASVVTLRQVHPYYQITSPAMQQCWKACGRRSTCISAFCYLRAWPLDLLYCRLLLLLGGLLGRQLLHCATFIAEGRGCHTAWRDLALGKQRSQIPRQLLLAAAERGSVRGLILLRLLLLMLLLLLTLMLLVGGHAWLVV